MTQWMTAITEWQLEAMIKEQRQTPSKRFFLHYIFQCAVLSRVVLFLFIYFVYSCCKCTVTQNRSSLYVEVHIRYDVDVVNVIWSNLSKSECIANAVWPVYSRLLNYLIRIQISYWTSNGDSVQYHYCLQTKSIETVL